MEPESALPGPRGVFFDEEQARAAVLRLAGEGWATHLDRGRFQGEDDDEDQPWVLTTEAPALVLELVVDELDGWFDDEEPVAPTQVPALPPLDLPTSPKRIKRPDLGSES